MRLWFLSLWSCCVLSVVAAPPVRAQPAVEGARADDEQAGRAADGEGVAPSSEAQANDGAASNPEAQADERLAPSPETQAAGAAPSAQVQAASAAAEEPGPEARADAPEPFAIVQAQATDAAPGAFEGAPVQSLPAPTLPEFDPVLAYEKLHAPRHRKLWIAAAEEVVFLGLGTLWYWLDKDRNLLDWDNPSWGERFSGDVLRMDNNGFAINWIWHPLSGAGFHVAPRALGANLFEAMAFSFFTSAAWEYLIEYREKVSINDLIATPVAGVALGEFAHRLALYLHRTPGKPTRAQRVVAWLLGPSEAVHRVRRRDPFDRADEADALGYGADIHHRFALRTGYAMAGARGEDGLSHASEIRLDGELIAIPSHLRPGKFRRFFREGDVTSLRLRMSFGSAHDADLVASTVLFGYYHQELGPALTGHTWLIGGDLLYRYRRMFVPGFRDDFSASDGGLVVRSWTRTRAGLVDIGLRVGPSFAGIRSFRFGDWRAENPDTVPKAILLKQNYAYHFGGSGSFSLAFQTDHLRAGSRVTAGHYNSIEGLDRTQEEVTHDVKAMESLLDWETFLEWTPLPARGFLVELSWLAQWRASQLEYLDATARLMRGFVLVGWVL